MAAAITSSPCEDHKCSQFVAELRRLQEQVSLLTTIHQEDQRLMESSISSALLSDDPHTSMVTRLKTSNPTAVPHQAWTTVVKHKKKKRSSWHSRLSPPPSEPLPLSNSYETLGNLGPPHGPPTPKRLMRVRGSTAPPMTPQRPSTNSEAPFTPNTSRLRGVIHATPNPHQLPAASWEVVMQEAGLSGLTPSKVGRQGDAPLPSDPASASCPPTVLVVGSSMVRHVVVPGAETHSVSGATAAQINNTISGLIGDRPHVSTAIVHIGANDLRAEQSEALKEEFVTLIGTVSRTLETCIISGPFPSPRYSDTRFSRALWLHLWLKGYCFSKGVPYIDNFNTYWNRRDLFARDRFHLNRAGARLLSLSMSHTLTSLAPLGQ